MTLLPQYQVQNEEKRRDPLAYRHPIIQQAINICWFRDKNDVGVVKHEHFSPMPISAIALTLTVVIIPLTDLTLDKY
jgi:Domain of unknown function (DUF6532)